MTTGRDAEARARALTDHDANLLVQAAAGTGKTSLIAGRVCLMLAEGVSPRDIAAITFTEAAASELGARVRTYVEELLAGRTPRPLRAVLPDGPSAAQAAALALAADGLDSLTLATIHGFCQALIRGYAIEADLDPGAVVLDREAQPALFDQVFDEWLAARLGAAPLPDDPIVILSRQDPRGFHARLQILARLRGKHRTARPVTPDISTRPDIAFADAATDFLRMSQSHAEATTGRQWREDVERLAGFYAGAFEGAPSFEQLWTLAHAPQLRSMRGKTRDLARPREASAWSRIFATQDTATVERIAAAFDRLDIAYRTLSAAVAGTLMARLAEALDGMLAAYRDRKRAAALMDFDDLLELAARLLQRRPEVRDALAGRYRRLLVDEFQDTDPVQCDILFRLAGAAAVEDWRRVALRPGALFLVGDPQQSLFRFRGAEVATYGVAKTVLEGQPGAAVLTVSRNFRSVDAILQHVNRCFETPLNAPGQPGYVALEADRETARHDLPCAAKLTIASNAVDQMPDLREAEAARVAEVCALMIGALRLRDADGERLLRAGDIALLAPAATDLWRYERALRGRGLPFASEAGKALFDRQETQDMLALVRALADPTDTIAFGALLRGPLVGLTDEMLLDAAAALPQANDGAPGRLSIRTRLEDVPDGLLRGRLKVLQELRRRASLTTPAVVLAEAVERLGVRATLALRDPRLAAAADANLDELLARASGYGVRGLRRLAHDLQADWSGGVKAREGQPEAGDDAIEIVTVHRAKGREWPVVIPINGMGGRRRRDDMLHSPADDTLHWTIGEIESPDLAVALAAEDAAEARERTRLLYVACTRAEDLLIVPHVAAAGPASYSRAADLAFDRLPEFPLDRLGPSAATPVLDVEGAQDADAFAAEAAILAERSAPIHWRTPSEHDADRLETDEAVDDMLYGVEESVEPVEGGRVRGLILHKLMEEVLGEGLADTEEALGARARLLNEELATEADARALDAGELARTVRSTLALPEVAALRGRLVPETPVYGMVAGASADGDPVGGRADAIAFSGQQADVVVDWKSDLAPSDAQTEAHVDQLRLYLAATGAQLGLVVYMSLGWVRTVRPAATFPG